MSVMAAVFLLGPYRIGANRQETFPVRWTIALSGFYLIAVKTTIPGRWSSTLPARGLSLGNLDGVLVGVQTKLKEERISFLVPPFFPRKQTPDIKAWATGKLEFTLECLKGKEFAS